MSEFRQAQQAITEGFICANCRKQFGGVDELLVHFELCQKAIEDGGGGAAGGIKGFFGKAKQKLRFEQSPSQFGGGGTAAGVGHPYGGGGGGNAANSEKTIPTPTYFNDFDNAVEVKGVVRSSFSDFKKIREGRLERHAAESNKLKIRLSKLVSGLEKFPALISKSTAGFQESSEWKAHEKSVVHWLDEKPVTRCPECAQGFGFLKRKHHCRLCGSILCNDCSDFIPIFEAFEILHSDKQIRDDSACASISFRVCVHCALILRHELQSPFAKIKKIDSTEGKLIALYDKVREKMTEIDKLLPDLVIVVDSIRSGESLYSKEEANLQRSKLLRATEQIDLLSKNISGLNSESSSMLMLQQRIRQNCIAYIRDFIRIVPQIPDMSEDSQSSSSVSSSVGGASGVVGDGWSISPPDHHGGINDGQGSSRPSSDIEDNPIQQQIKNVKFYIQQAQAAGRTDEVDMLAASLRELLLWQKNEQE